jgi:hypothetical protein
LGLGLGRGGDGDCTGAGEGRAATLVRAAARAGAPPVCVAPRTVPAVTTPKPATAAVNSRGSGRVIRWLVCKCLLSSLPRRGGALSKV